MHGTKPLRLSLVECNEALGSALHGATSSGFGGDGEPRLASTRPSGVEVVRAELIAVLGGPYNKPPVVDGLLARAGRLHDARERSLAEQFKVAGGGAPWSDASAVTVRAWVAVAREAARL